MTEDGRRKRVPNSVSNFRASRSFSSVLCRPSSVIATTDVPQEQVLKIRAIKFERAISTGKLNALPRLHTRPINVVVYHGSSGRPGFEVGFSLRCFQRLSRPYIATQHCGWRHNCSTRGTSIPVLSY